jgi:hypothetical protein
MVCLLVPEHQAPSIIKLTSSYMCELLQVPVWMLIGWTTAGR